MNFDVSPHAFEVCSTLWNSLSMQLPIGQYSEKRRRTKPRMAASRLRSVSDSAIVSSLRGDFATCTEAGPTSAPAINGEAKGRKSGDHSFIARNWSLMNRPQMSKNLSYDIAGEEPTIDCLEVFGLFCCCTFCSYAEVLSSKARAVKVWALIKSAVRSVL